MTIEVRILRTSYPSPLFIVEVGGGFEDFLGCVTGAPDAPPLKVVVILGLNLVLSFQVEFTLKAIDNPPG